MWTGKCEKASYCSKLKRKENGEKSFDKKKGGEVVENKKWKELKQVEKLIT